MTLKCSLVVPIILLWLTTCSFAATERILGVYILQQHGKRTPRLKPPVALTEQGKHEQYHRGRHFHDRYISNASDVQIWGLRAATGSGHRDGSESRMEVDGFQVAKDSVEVESPDQDMILQSGNAFLRGLWGGSEETGAPQSIAHASAADAKQPVAIKTFKVDKSINSFWDPNVDGCRQFHLDMDEYERSSTYADYLKSTLQFYMSLEPIVETTSYALELNYDKAYQLWDIFNSDLIHRPNIESEFALANLSSQDVMEELLTFAVPRRLPKSVGWWGKTLIRRIGGRRLIGKVLSKLNKMTDRNNHERLHIEFGSPELLISFFEVHGYDVDFPLGAYSSSMVWELVTKVQGDKFPSKEDILVRCSYIYYEGPNASLTTATVYPLFDLPIPDIPWKDFDRLSKDVGMTSTEKWCRECDNTAGKCALYLSEDNMIIATLFSMLFGVPLVIGIAVCCYCYRDSRCFGYCFELIKASFKWPIKLIKSFICYDGHGLKWLGQWMGERIEIVVDYMGSGMNLLGTWVAVLFKGPFNMSVAFVRWILNKEDEHKSKPNNTGDADVWGVEMVEGVNRRSPV